MNLTETAAEPKFSDLIEAGAAQTQPMRHALFRYDPASNEPPLACAEGAACYAYAAQRMRQGYEQINQVWGEIFMKYQMAQTVSFSREEFPEVFENLAQAGCLSETEIEAGEFEGSLDRLVTELNDDAFYPPLQVATLLRQLGY